MKSPLSAAAVLIALAAPAVAFEGDYGYEKGNAFGSAKIEKSGGGYVAKFEIGSPGCTGDVETKGRESGGVLTLKATDGGTCDLAVRHSGGGITVKEIGDCDMHGSRCSFSGPYPRIGAAPAGSATPTEAPATAPGKSGKLTGEFYCADELDLSAEHKADPTYRLSPPKSGAAASPLTYAFSYHAGALTVSDGGDTTTFKPVKVSIRGEEATYTGPEGAKWVVSPVGARDATIRGTGLSGPSDLVACGWR